MKTFYLARQLLRRDWRSGELLTLCSALLIAVSAVLTISLITDRLTAGMLRESAELIGGDLVINSTREPDPGWRQQGEAQGMESAMVYRFDSVLFHGDELLLANIKAVSPEYPLLGKLRVSDGIGEDSRETDTIPAPGTAWADPRVLERLHANVGDDIQFGAITLRISHLLTYEPDQGNSLFQFAPRLLINASDLAPAQVMGPGARIQYRTLFHSENPETMTAFRQQLEPRLDVGHTLIVPSDDKNRASSALLKATQYVRIATLLSLVLAAIAIALTARRYSERHRDQSAMLRCLGAQQSTLVRLYLYQLALVTSATVILAFILGWLSHEIVLAVLKPLLPVDMPPPSLSPWLVAGGSAVLLIGGFALPPLLRLANTPPLRVLRRELAPVPLSTWLVSGLAALSQGLLLWLLFDDIPEMLLVLVAVAISLFVVGGLIYWGLKKLRHSIPRNGNLLLRSLRNLSAHAGTSTSQIMAFAITLMLVMVVAQLRTGLLSEWQAQLPAQVPNHFAFNIFPDQADRFRQLVAPVADLKTLYPVVRGRLVAINGENSTILNERSNERELNLTWTDQLPEENTVVEGTWPPREQGVSVEQEYAERLGIKVGDTLQLNVSGTLFTSQVSSLRSVKWESFTPNFFLIFSQQQLGDLPTTYLTSFRLEASDRTLLKTLFSEFPAITLIEVDALLARLQSVLSQVSLAVELVMLFVLLSAFAVLFATLQSTADERLQEGALMRAVGASRHYLKTVTLAEFGLLGLMAGILAVIGSEITTAVIYRKMFDLPASPHPWLWLALPAAMAALVAVAGYLGSRQVLSRSPTVLLNN